MQGWMNQGASNAAQSNVNFFIGNASQSSGNNGNNGNGGKWSLSGGQGGTGGQQSSGANSSSWSPVTNSPFGNLTSGSSGVANESSLLTTNTFLKDD